MKVTFTQDVKGKGKKGEVKDVPVGYTNSFLLESKYAVEVTPGNLKQLGQQNRRAETDRQQGIDDVEALKAKLEDIEVEVSVKTDEGGELSGSTSTRRIADVLKNQYDIKIDKHKMDLPHGIRTSGYTSVPVKLDREVEGTVHVHTVEK